MANKISFQTIEAIPIRDDYGAEIRKVDWQNMGDTQYAEIMMAWKIYGLLQFDDVDVSDDGYVAFARRMGTITKVSQQMKGEAAAHPMHEEIYRAIETDASVSRDLQWHSDANFEDRPADCVLFKAVDVPEENCVGTFFSDMRRVHRSLHQDTLRQLAGRKVAIQSVLTPHGTPRPGQIRPHKQLPFVEHAIVQKDAGGEDCIYLGTDTHLRYIPDMELEAGKTRLDELWQVVKTEEFWLKVDWKPGRLIMWDNRRLVHTRGKMETVSNAPPARRVLDRITIHCNPDVSV